MRIAAVVVADTAEEELRITEFRRYGSEVVFLETAWLDGIR